MDFLISLEKLKKIRTESFSFTTSHHSSVIASTQIEIEQDSMESRQSSLQISESIPNRLLRIWILDRIYQGPMLSWFMNFDRNSILKKNLANKTNLNENRFQREKLINFSNGIRIFDPKLDFKIGFGFWRTN